MRRLAALVLAVLVGVLAIASIWANQQLLDTGGWDSVSGRLLESREVRQRVAVFLGEELVSGTEEQLDAAGEEEVAAEVVPRLRAQSIELAERVMATQRFEVVWRSANQVGHRALLWALDEGGTRRHGSDAVVVDLTPALQQLAELAGEAGLARELGVSDLGKRVEPGAARIRVLEGEAMTRTRDVVRVVRHLTVPALIVVLALYALALYLGRRRLSGAFLGVGIALTATGALALLARTLAGHKIVDDLLSRGADRAGAEAAWGIATSTIAYLSIGAIALGALVSAGALILPRVVGPR